MQSKLGLSVNKVHCLKEGKRRVPTKKLLEITHTQEKENNYGNYYERPKPLRVTWQLIGNCSLHSCAFILRTTRLL